VLLSARTIVDAPGYPEREIAPDCPPRRGCLHAGAGTALLARTAGRGYRFRGWPGDIGYLEGRGDALMALETGMAVVDVSVAHPANFSLGPLL
jgi:hypothetical protein